jgi:hypothetical protein
MLRLIGVKLHPGVRVLIGAAILALGVVRGAAAAEVVGVALVIWGVAAVVQRR